jgi:hypothetical protein
LFSDHIQLVDGRISAMGDFLTVVAIIVFVAVFLALIKGLEHV